MTAPSQDKKWKKAALWAVVTIWVIAVIADIIVSTSKEISANKEIIKLKESVNAITAENKQLKKSNEQIIIYLKRLDSIGVKRDSITNKPIITKRLNITNYIGKVDYLEQH